MPFTEHDFDELFARSDDPWQFRTRWYEQRKRDLILACLPRPRYRSAYEPGCANGELSAALAARCDRLLVSDGSERAVALARSRLKAFDGVDVIRAWLPRQWPARVVDLVVLSEVGYFLDAPALEELAACTERTLDLDGTVLACHWRHPIERGSLDGDDVHSVLDACWHDKLGLARLGSWIERDFRVDVWGRQDDSPAQQEFLSGTAIGANAARPDLTDR
jgi:SAM-dependent methyltransferase